MTLPFKNKGLTRLFQIHTSLLFLPQFAISGQAVDIVNQTIKSANVQECVTYVRGDIPEVCWFLYCFTSKQLII